MHDDPDLFPFPELRDDAVIAVNHFLEEFYTRFQNHYFTQMHRYYAEQHEQHRYNDQMPLNLNDPPF
jgi:hypothetical protein